MKIIEKPRTPVSNICHPKCDVHKQNAKTEAWMRDNPDKVKYLKNGETFRQFRQLSTVS